MERILRTRLVTGLVLLVVFGAGLSLGFALERARSSAPDEEVARPARSEEGEDRGRDRRPMYEQVGPSDEQKVRIDSIVAEHREAMKALHAEFRAAYNPRYDALIEQTRAAIKGVLTPQQAAAYDSLLAAYEQRRAERSSRDDRD